MTAMFTDSGPPEDGIHNAGQTVPAFLENRNRAASDRSRNAPGRDRSQGYRPDDAGPGVLDDAKTLDRYLDGRTSS